MQVINSNSASLNAQRNLGTSGAQLATSLQRLSSGLRINSAKDDAAGLAIAERFTSQIRGLNVASRNANDAISLAQTAEGALAEVGNNLQRIRELAVQSRNGSNSLVDRQALDVEVQLLKAEIDRVANQSQFNGTRLLDGSFGTKAFQVGADSGDLITISGLGSTRTADLGVWQPTAVAPTTSVASGFSTGIALGGVHNFIFEIDGATVFTKSSVTTPDFVTAGELDSAIDAFVAGSSGLYTRSGSLASGNLVLSKTDGTAMTIARPGNYPLGGTFSPGFLATFSNGTPAGVAETGFANESVLTPEASDRMMLAMDAALTTVNSRRAELGALQNRFSSVIQNLQTASENLSASRSRIRDADYAKETAELTRGQILQQAGTAMLAQANQLPQNVLSLLR